MKLKIIVFICLSLLFLAMPQKAMAIVDPTLVLNNKLGVHLLDPSELSEASKLVNNDAQGSWGYVTVPIQSGDRDRNKWINFMKTANDLKVIPIIRVATFAQGANWAEPNNYDLVDFANFLNDLPWPTKNRYVIIFNEVNRADEYGGLVSPEHYADILVNAINIFKARNDNFFILPAGLDDAANDRNSSIRWKDYLRRMNLEQPGIFNELDGWTSHSYPNPDFVGNATDRHDHSIQSFRYELQFISQFTNKKLPVFITETGWNMQAVPQDKVKNFYQYAFSNVWNTPDIIAVTPFLLNAGAGPFTKFSLLDSGGQPTAVYKLLQTFATKGNPVLASNNIMTGTKIETIAQPTGDAQPEIHEDWSNLKDLWDSFIKLLFGQSSLSSLPTKQVTIGDKELTVEIADTPSSRQQGLSDRDSMPNDHGMLFIFNTPNFYTFWMHNMHFDLDLIWMYNDHVVGISHGDHNTPDATIAPPQQIDKVLELNTNSGVKLGDQLKFK